MEISEVNPDGNVYQLKDATARTEIAQIKAQNTYSTEKTDTGKKWIDGKTIYRVTTSGTKSIPANSTVTLFTIPVGGALETVISANVYWRRENDPAWGSMSANGRTTITRRSGNNIIVEGFTVDAITSKLFIATVEFTLAN